MVPPKCNDRVAVVVLEPNAGVAREVRRMRSRFKKLYEERKRQKKKSSSQSSRMMVLHHTIEGPPPIEVLPTFQSLDLDKGPPGSVPVHALDEILKSFQANVQLEVM